MTQPEASRDARPVRAVLLAVALVFLASLSLAEAGARLERKVVPTFESVKLTLDPSKPIYNGSVHVDLNAKEATSSLDFHARGVTIERLVLARAAAGASP